MSSSSQQTIYIVANCVEWEVAELLTMFPGNNIPWSMLSLYDTMVTHAEPILEYLLVALFIIVERKKSYIK